MLKSRLMFRFLRQYVRTNTEDHYKSNKNKDLRPGALKVFQSNQLSEQAIIQNTWRDNGQTYRGQFSGRT